ncbi:hypothetical protein NK8_79370 (plasmid) [Caballeronia sp. NK8]|nr:hypothetical protein NK8_79370 [Caballeronia sp. NK8]
MNVLAKATKSTSLYNGAVLVTKYESLISGHSDVYNRQLHPDEKKLSMTVPTETPYKRARKSYEERDEEQDKS